MMVNRLAFRTLALFALLPIVPLNLGLAAQSEEIEASAQYVLGDNDSKLDGRRLALLEAKRNALEKAGTYIESLTEVKNFQLSQDQVRSYAAGILEVKEAGEKWDKVGDNLAVTLSVKIKVDKEVIAKQLVALRKNSEATEALEEARAKIQEYERMITELNQNLKMAKGPAAEAAKESRSKALTGIDVETLVAQARVAMTGKEDEMAVTILGTTSTSGRERARGLLEEAFKVDPKNSKVLNGLGFLYLEDKNYSKAEAFFRNTIRLQPDNIVAHNDLGVTLKQQGDLAGAIEEFRRAISLKPDVAEFHKNLGDVLMLRGDLPEAISELRETIRLKPDHAFAHANLGIALFKYGDLPGSEQHLRQSISLQPDSALAHRALGTVLIDRSDVQGGGQEYMKACQLV